jgi:DNA-binding transcriptional ArsR family regulator
MTLHHPAKEALALPAILHALSDPHRLRVVRILAESTTPRRCGSFGLSVTKSTATHHFRVLRDAGLIEQHEDGTARMNSLRRDDLDERFPGLLDAILRSAPALEPSARGDDRADDRGDATSAMVASG